MARRKVQPDILAAAIKLYGLYGYQGVTTRGLAKEAKVVEGAIYSWFTSKQNLYLQAVNTVVAETNEGCQVRINCRRQPYFKPARKAFISFTTSAS